MRQEILQKVQDFFATGDGHYAYLGVYLLVHQLNLSPIDALKTLTPTEEPDLEGGEYDFTCHYRIGAVHIAYTVMEGYVPYMGAGITATRLVGIEEGTAAGVDTSAWAGYLSIGDGDPPAYIRQLIREDYEQLLPEVVDWLNADPKTAFV